MARPANEHDGVRREPANERSDGEQRNAERKNLPPAIEIGQRSGREQKARIDEIVGVDHPLQRVHAGAEIDADLLHREVDDGGVDLSDQHAERHGQQNERGDARDLRGSGGQGRGHVWPPHSFVMCGHMRNVRRSLKF